MDQVEALKKSIKPEGRLSGKVAIVTGGASSIGRAISLAYAREGAKVIIGDRRADSRDENEAAITTHDLITKAGGTASFSELDVANSDGFEKVVQDTVSQHGRLDILVNNAGVAPTGAEGSDCPIWESKDEGWNLAMEVNARGVFNGIRAATKVMVKQEPGLSGDRGWIVNLASIYGLVGTTGIAAYVASKHACMGITRSAALDCAPYRVHVNAICPGWIKTSMTKDYLARNPEAAAALTYGHPFGGMGTAEDIAPVAVFLASEDARWVTGAPISVDGGFVSQ